MHRTPLEANERLARSPIGGARSAIGCSVEVAMECRREGSNRPRGCQRCAHDQAAVIERGDARAIADSSRSAASTGRSESTAVLEESWDSCRWRRRWRRCHRYGRS